MQNYRVTLSGLEKSYEVTVCVQSLFESPDGRLCSFSMEGKVLDKDNPADKIFVASAATTLRRKVAGKLSGKIIKAKKTLKRDSGNSVDSPPYSDATSGVDTGVPPGRRVGEVKKFVDGLRRTGYEDLADELDEAAQDYESVMKALGQIK